MNNNVINLLKNSKIELVQSNNLKITTYWINLRINGLRVSPFFKNSITDVIELELRADEEDEDTFEFATMISKGETAHAVWAIINQGLTKDELIDYLQGVYNMVRIEAKSKGLLSRKGHIIQMTKAAV